MADQTSGRQDGVSRRQFLKFAGIGFAAGFAAMLIGSRGRGKKQAPSVPGVSDDSMFRPKESTRPRS
ncbi:MAG: twin-arginine translocation signal domain-containing protein [Chloroflexi bacterium]|nr:twin-arginine translocation signal domain-containing protein [Chloroflexota bacterium]